MFAPASCLRSPDIASRFRDDEQNLSFLSAINVQAMGGSATIGV